MPNDPPYRTLVRSSSIQSPTYEINSPASTLRTRHAAETSRERPRRYAWWAARVVHADMLRRPISIALEPWRRRMASPSLLPSTTSSCRLMPGAVFLTPTKVPRLRLSLLSSDYECRVHTRTCLTACLHGRLGSRRTQPLSVSQNRGKTDSEINNRPA